MAAADLADLADHPDHRAPNGWPSWVLRGFRDGERRALAEVYRAHVHDVAKKLRHGFAFEAGGTVHRFVGYHSAFELQDALHETFRRAFEPSARLSYDGIRPYGPYLGAIAKHVVLRGFRAQRARFPIASIAADEVEAIVADEAAISPEIAVGREQLRAIVQGFLAELGEDERRLVTVRFIEGISQRDAATQLGLGRQQIRSREAKLRKRLLAHLRRHLGAQPARAWSMLAMLVSDAVLLAEAVREGVGAR